jgi:hypothetical protein
MPTVLVWNGYRFYFFSNEGTEPPHIHVDKSGNSVKFRLDPVSIARNYGFSEREARAIKDKVQEKRDSFIEAWNDYFSNGR